MDVEFIVSFQCGDFGVCSEGVELSSPAESVGVDGVAGEVGRCGGGATSSTRAPDATGDARRSDLAERGPVRVLGGGSG